MRTFSILYTQARPFSDIRVDLVLEPFELRSEQTCYCVFAQCPLQPPRDGGSSVTRHGTANGLDSPSASRQSLRFPGVLYGLPRIVANRVNLHRALGGSWAVPDPIVLESDGYFFDFKTRDTTYE